MRKVFKFLLVATTSTLLSLLMVEIFLQNYNFAPKLKSARYEFDCFEDGTYYYLKLKENTKCVFKSLIGAFPDVEYKIAPIPPKLEDKKRVLFIGDSFTMGVGVKPDNSYPSKVGEILGSNYEVINSGLLGTGPTYYYLYLKNEIERINPDIIVIGFHPATDLYENLDHIIWQDIDQNGLPEKATVDDSFENLDIDIQTDKSKNKLRIVELFKNTFYPKKYVLPDDITIVCVYKENCRRQDNEIAKVKKLFLAIKDLTNNRKLLVAMFPAEFQIYDVETKKYGFKIPFLPSDRVRPNKMFEAFFNENNIKNIDLIPVLTKYMNEEIYYEKDDHLNNRGNEIVASEVSSVLLDFEKE